MTDRSHTEAVTYRVAVAALQYHPDKPTTEPGYTIDEDLDWCLAGLEVRSASSLAAVRKAAAAAITDPTAHREDFLRVLDQLRDDHDA